MKNLFRLRQTAAEPFFFNDRLSKPLLAVFVAINVLVLTNAVLHDPTIGFDSSDHVNYITVLAAGRLPTPDESFEFFAAPLPYALPALLMAWGARLGVVLKAAQLFNVFCSIGLTFYLIRLCRIARPVDPSYSVWSLLLLGMLPVYHRTMAFIQGEPLAALLAVMCVYQTLVAVRDNLRPGQLLILGMSLGLLVLAKQWGVLVLVAIVLFIAIFPPGKGRPWRRHWQAVGAPLLVALTVGGWFYLSLYQRFGTVAAFNEPRAPRWSLANRPRDFYVGLGLGKLFTDPVRESFSQFIPYYPKIQRSPP